MARPRFFRDPVHGQIRFYRTPLDAPCPKEADRAISWIIPKLINTQVFQRLRHARQNALSNYVFYGLEHSRFTHSIGVYHVADTMYQAVVRNTNEDISDDISRISVAVAALLHDIGHGPFSHSLEELVRGLKMPFHHERMTIRFILEDPEIQEVLNGYDPNLAEEVTGYIDKSRQKREHWSYKVVSSQFDADRIDYMMRDSQLAGFKGQGFDLPRLLDLIYASHNRVVIDRHATEALESYLITLMHLYIAIYYHKGVRGATATLLATLRRAFDLHSEDKAKVFENTHPLALLLKHGEKIELQDYRKLTEYQIWNLISDWTSSEDRILADLSKRLLGRQSFKGSDFDYHSQNDPSDILDQIRAEIAAQLQVSEDEVKRYYFREDNPDRTGYTAYNWLSPKGGDQSIWLGTPGEDPIPIELETQNEIFKGLREKRIFSRLLYPSEVHKKVRDILSS